MPDRSESTSSTPVSPLPQPSTQGEGRSGKVSGSRGSNIAIPAPTEWCIDYGHHGSVECVFCGLLRPVERSSS
jgi:hypothetical protein